MTLVANKSGLNRGGRFLLCGLASFVLAAASAGCSTSNAEPTPHMICGYVASQGGLRGGGPWFIDLASPDAPVRAGAYGVGVPGDGTVVRVSGDCQRGASVSLTPPSSATLTVLVKAKNNRPEAVRVALHPDQRQTTLVVTDANGKKHTLELTNPAAVSPTSTTS